MKKIKRIMAVLICMTITLTGIPVSVNAENSGGKSVQTMETGNELFITLEENTRYRWNVNDSAEKNSVVHLDTSGASCIIQIKGIPRKKVEKKKYLRVK